MRPKVANNYSGLKNRDKKIYAVAGTKVSTTGLSYKFISVFSVVFIAFNVIGVIICIAGGYVYYMPIRSGSEAKIGFLVFFAGSPFLVTLALLHFKIQKYSLLEFLAAYFKPKYIRDHNGKRVKYTNYKQNTVFEKIL